MPIKVVCSQCSYVLLENADLDDYASSLYKFVGQKCPECGHQLSSWSELTSKAVDVKPDPATLRKNSFLPATPPAKRPPKHRLATEAATQERDLRTRAEGIFS
jgi:DNA-directed RNA polymerase subunit RPC12/RpoP